MDLLAFLTWQFIFFCLGIVAVLLVIQKIVEYLSPNVTNNKFWNKLFLPIFPIILGGIMALLLKAYPYANGFTSPGDHIVYGIVSGLLSGLVYGVIKNMLGSKIQAIINIIVKPSNSSDT